MTTKTLLALSAALAGCASPPRLAPQDSTKYRVESTEKFVLLDEAAQAAVTGTGLQERLLSDGRLEVVANVKNREDRPVEVQVQCLFADAQGFPWGDPAPWRALSLAAQATEAVRFTAPAPQAKRYVIRVRGSR